MLKKRCLKASFNNDKIRMAEAHNKVKEYDRNALVYKSPKIYVFQIIK